MPDPELETGRPGFGFRHISVYYPRGLRTGGPEALHQLVDALRGLGHEAFLVPVPGTESEERVADYAKYDAPEVATPYGGPDDAIVVPEVFPNLVPRRHQATMYCWWLSIDNSPLFAADQRWSRRQLGELGGPSALRLRVSRARAWARRWWWHGQMKSIQHLAQSHYARVELGQRFHVVPRLLTDYVTIADAAVERPRQARPTVAYNVAKSGALVDRLRSGRAWEADWVPIAGMTPAEVSAALGRSQVYLDLGPQPGKDRMPREAALAGAVTLVARTGAGRYYEDFALPPEHRIPLEPDLLSNAGSALAQVLEDPAHHFALQAEFRAAISGERDAFRREVAEIFGRGRP